MGKRRSEEDWQFLFEAFNDSGESKKAFCRRQGICDSHFGKKYRAWQAGRGKALTPSGFQKATLLPAPQLGGMTLRWKQTELELPSSISTPWLVDLLHQLSRLN